MKDVEKILRAMANKRRLAILRFLKTKKEAPVGEIAEEIQLSFRSTSKHLGILTAAEIVDKNQRSLQVFYKLSQTMPVAAKHILQLI